MIEPATYTKEQIEGMIDDSPEVIRQECFEAGKRWGQELHKVPRGEG